jgi:hypothetical protein
MQKFKVLLLALCSILIGSLASPVVAQTCPAVPTSTAPYILLDSEYQVGTVASGKTFVGICYSNPTTTSITAVQFRVWYDTLAFDGATPIVTSLNTSWSQSLNYVVNPVEGNITITLVYTGSDSTFTMPTNRQFRIEFNHSSSFQNFTSISAMKVTGTTPFLARASNVNGLDDTLRMHSYGGVMKNVKLKFHGKFANVTGSGAKNLTVALEKKPITSGSWTQVNAYVTDSVGNFNLIEDVDTTYYSARLFVKGDTLGVGNIVSAADAQKANDYILGLATPTGFDFYTADVNGSNGISVADVYSVFGRIAGRFTAWPNSVKEILFFSQSEYNTINGSSTNYRSTISGTTNLYYTVSGGVIDSVEFYVAIPGDVNGTGYHMARLTPIAIVNPANAHKYVIDETVTYDNTNLIQIEINLPKLSVEEGNLVNVPVKVLTNGKSIGSLQLALKYDPSLLDFKGLTASSKSQKWVTFVNPADSTIEWGGFDPSGKNNLLNDGDQAVILQFTALKPQDEWGKSPLYTTRKFAGDYNASDVIITPANGMVQVLRVIGGGFNLNPNQEMEVYPNPTEGEIRIAFKILQDTKAIVAIYDINGKRTLEIVNEENMPAGTYNYSADLGNLSAGTYTAILQTQDSKLVAKKIIKTK